MMQRTLEQEPVIRRVLSNDRKASHLVPTWQDVDILEGVVKALEPVADFTDMPSGKLSSAWSPNTNICRKLYNCHHSKAVTVYNVRFSFIIIFFWNKSDVCKLIRRLDLNNYVSRNNRPSVVNT